MVKTFRDICIQKNIWVKASYIESKHKKVADKESRKVHDNLEWTLKQHVFEKVIKLFGKVTIDLFASHVNIKSKGTTHTQWTLILAELTLSPKIGPRKLYMLFHHSQ